jgi:hypothetical protein
MGPKGEAASKSASGQRLKIRKKQEIRIFICLWREGKMKIITSLIKMRKEPFDIFFFLFIITFYFLLALYQLAFTPCLLPLDLYRRYKFAASPFGPMPTG